MKMLFAAVLAALVAVSGTVRAATPLVDAAWVKANGGKPNVVLLDVQPLGLFMQGHIPGSVNTDFAKAGWRAEIDHVEDMMNTTEKLEKLIGSLGIDNAAHVVIVANGANAGEMGVGTRIYWTFKMLGHEEVSLLNGGFRAWAADKQAPVAKGEGQKVAAKTFKAKTRRTDLVVTKEEVAAAISKGTLLVDSRPEDQYVGINRNPKSKRNGTLPGAVNVPNTWMTENNGGKFHNAETLRKLYAAARVSPDAEQITFCNTGHLASVGWFVSYELLGNKKVKMYDGSMVEWTMDPKRPVEQKVQVTR
ncbi:MAG: sulfurtransferase [Alphaproteobacteria bacterium]|nr:sulfurtransferase [Alphaproteobacteria bacterium]